MVFLNALSEAAGSTKALNSGSEFHLQPYLEIGNGVGGGEPGRAGVLLVAKGSVEGLGDGAQIEGTDSGRRYAVPGGEEEATAVRVQQFS